MSLHTHIAAHNLFLQKYIIMLVFQCKYFSELPFVSSVFILCNYNNHFPVTGPLSYLRIKFQIKCVRCGAVT